MRQLFITTLLTSLALAPAHAGRRTPPLLKAAVTEALAQESYAQKRTREILASLNKRKHMVKEKYGIRRERYKEIRSEPVVKREVKDYAGTYEVAGLDYTLRMRVGSGGEIEATGSEPVTAGAPRARRFTLKDARVEGALLTASKVYEDGVTEKFEGVFINMTDIEGVSPDRIERSATTFGLGVAGVRVGVADGIILDKLFYQLRR